MPDFSLHFSHPPPAGYYPKFGGPVAAISFQKGVAWDVDGLPTISAKSWENHGQRVDIPGDPILKSNLG